jgi:glyoxylase-like metal-dependent hydrolase (beta-lactamase superfamily II)
MFSSGDLNSGIIATSEGVVVFDALDSEAVGRAEREAIANTIRQPVRFLVSSPYHNPYSKGNAAYADVWKIGHELYRADLVRQLERDKASPEEQKARLPNQTFRDRITLYLGGKEIQVLYLAVLTHGETASSMFRRTGSSIRARSFPRANFYS